MDRLMREALERSHNHLKYQYETDKQRLKGMNNVQDWGAAISGLDILSSVLNQNERVLSNKDSEHAS